MFPEAAVVVSPAHVEFPLVVESDPLPSVVDAQVSNRKPEEVVIEVPGGQRIDVPIQPGENEVTVTAKNAAGVEQLIASRMIYVVDPDSAADLIAGTEKDDDPGAGNTPDLGAAPVLLFGDAPQLPFYFWRDIFSCFLDVDVHRSINQEDSEPLVPESRDFSHGAYSLRNDDADWLIGNNVQTDQLPVAVVQTDAVRQFNDRENDLIKVDGINLLGLDQVYLFAFELESEDDRNLGTSVDSKTGGQVSAAQLKTWTDAKKSATAEAFPIPIPVGTKSVWVEGLLGGKYRLVVGLLPPGVKPEDVTYDVATQTTNPGFACIRQATLTVVVVDIFQKTRRTVRNSAFDVYWGGLPYFSAEAWPGGGQFEWAVPYKLGTNVNQPPGQAVAGQVAFMERDTVENEPRRPGTPDVGGENVQASGNAPAGNKAQFHGGIEVAKPRRGNRPAVQTDPNNRYPERISVAYTVDGERLVRPEPLAVIFPQLGEVPAAQTQTGNDTGVQVRIAYTITDAFSRAITAPRVTDYVSFYGAGLKAWEGLAAFPGQIAEGGSRNDDVTLINVPAGTTPINLGTAQRSQAAVRNDRMTAGTFTDTLRFQSSSFDNWAHWTGNKGPAARGAIQREAAQRRQAIRQGNRRQVAPVDLRRVTRHTIFAMPQDVILQLRFGSGRQDVNVLQGNTLTLYAPYFFRMHQGYQRGSPPFSYHMQYTPGIVVQTLVDTNHRRTPP